MHLPGWGEIVDIAAAPGQKPQILLAPDRLPDTE
jgi:hypothetical protein